MKRSAKSWQKYGLALAVLAAFVVFIRFEWLTKGNGATSPQTNIASSNINGLSVDVIKSLSYINIETKTADKNAKGVILNDMRNSYEGVSLYSSSYSDEAYLIDMKGNTLHRWGFPRENIWSQPELLEKKWSFKGFRNTYATADLDLFAIYDYLGLIKVDRNSQMVWLYRGGCHHDFWLTPDGEIYALTHKVENIPTAYNKGSIIVDYITILDTSGKEKASHSLLEILEKSRFDFLLPNITPSKPETLDTTHANSIQVFDGRFAGTNQGIFKKGNILVSSRHLNFVFIIDGDNWEVVWGWGPNNILRQHKARLTNEGNITIFNNHWSADTKRVSSVIEIEPISGKVLWEYRGTLRNPFFTSVLGSHQRLPNGNTLIVESGKGTAFEVTPENVVVWKFVAQGEVNGKVAAVPEMYRYEKDYFKNLDAFPKDK